MNKKFINTMQKRIVKFLKGEKNIPLYLLSHDNCSEVSRLVGCWILKEMENTEIFILKGRNILDRKNKEHDILAIKDSDNIYLIDPTVWQFFKNKRSIFIGISKNIDDSLNLVKKTYKGIWKVSEKLENADCAQKKEWEKIISENIKYVLTDLKTGLICKI